MHEVFILGSLKDPDFIMAFSTEGRAWAWAQAHGGMEKFFVDRLDVH